MSIDRTDYWGELPPKKRELYEAYGVNPDNFNAQKRMGASAMSAPVSSGVSAVIENTDAN